MYSTIYHRYVIDSIVCHYGKQALRSVKHMQKKSQIRTVFYSISKTYIVYLRTDCYILLINT